MNPSYVKSFEIHPTRSTLNYHALKILNRPKLAVNHRFFAFPLFDNKLVPSTGLSENHTNLALHSACFRPLPIALVVRKARSHESQNSRSSKSKEKETSLTQSTDSQHILGSFSSSSAEARVRQGGRKSEETKK